LEAAPAVVSWREIATLGLESIADTTVCTSGGRGVDIAIGIGVDANILIGEEPFPFFSGKLIARFELMLMSMGEGLLELLLEFVRRRGLDKIYKEEEEEGDDCRILVGSVGVDGDVDDIPIRLIEDIRNASVVLRML